MGRLGVGSMGSSACRVLARSKLRGRHCRGASYAWIQPDDCAEDPSDWESLLAAERHLQALLPGTVLVGGTAAALHVGHRASLDGVLTGIRQLRRVRPLETEEIAGLRVPTLGEMTRIKAWLLVTRLTTRDYLDTVVLLERLGEDGVESALRSLDELYPQPNGASVLAEMIERLGSAQPVDLASVDLASYRGLEAPWNDWQHVAARGRAWARKLAELLLTGREDG